MTLNEIQKAKLVVLQNAFGICSLSEAELYQALEKIYWLGFKAGNEFASPGLLEAAKRYAEWYCRDEAESPSNCTCGERQYEDAKALFAAIEKAAA